MNVDPAATSPRLTPGPIQYELRIGVTGHRELTNPAEVEVAVRSLLQHVVDVLEQASAAPLGPHGSPQSRVDRFDRSMARCLAIGTRIVCPALDLFTGLVLAPLRWAGAIQKRRTYWPRVPSPSDRIDVDLQTPVKLTVISALAKGADQIVARVVCDLVRNREQRNRYLEAVLPLPPRIYEEDFDDQADRDAFHQLLKVDRGNSHTHPEPTVLFPQFPGCPDPADPTTPLTREQAYAAAGHHVVETSEVIVAVWDPAREEKPGGTGVTVRHALDRGRLVLWLNPADLAAGPFVLRPGRCPEDSVVEPSVSARSWPARMVSSWRRFWHEAPTDGQQEIDDSLQRQAPSGLRLELIPNRAKQLSRNFHRLAAYNRDPATDHELLQQETHDQAAKLKEIANGSALPQPATRVIVEALLPHVVRADHLSIRYKELRNAAARLWPTAAAVTVTLMAFQILFLPQWHRLAFVELAVLLLGYISYRVSLYDAWHEKWLNDRRLAEGLRAALFTALVPSEDDSAGRDAGLASLGGTFGQIQDPLPFYKPANAWFVATLKRLLRKERRRFAGSLDVSDTTHRTAVASFLRSAWIHDQAEHHTGHAKDCRRVAAWSKRLRLAMILALILVATLHAFGIGHHEGERPANLLTELDLWIAFATVALPAWAAAFHVMLSLDDHERLAERSALMAPLLRGVAERLAQVATLARLRECVAEAERITDLESREWAESLVDRKPEFTG